jgi:predicted glutamine amidotransferase
LCGIAGFHIKHKGKVKQHDQMEHFADLLLTGIEMRGKQATGFVAVTQDGKRYEIDKRPKNAAEFIKDRKRLPVGTRTFLGHTRYATQGSNENHANLHPVISGTCLLTHNGGIWNDDKLFEEHDIKRAAEVDTEIIPALIHKHGWENAAKALHELKGSFAIAAVDLKHAGEVLLAKGDSSPLYWIETENFVVWCSTELAIRNAWKEVLGTPPAFKKFSKLNEGDMLWIKGNVIEPAKFELPTYPFRRADDPARKASESKSGRTESGSRSHDAHGGLRTIFERRASGSSNAQQSSTSRGARGVVPDRAAEVKQLRADGNGKAILHGTPIEDVRAITGGANPIFNGCPGCGGLILEQSFVTRTGEGRICTDCNYIAEWGTTRLVIDPGTLNHMNSWCKREVGAHTRALFEVSKQTKLEVQAIDYLVFRTPAKYLDDHPHIADLAEKLDDLYQEAYSAAFDDLLDDVLDENKAKESRGSEDEKPWAVQTSNKNNVHPITQKWLPETCGTCKKFKKKDAECAFCARVKEKAESTREQTRVSTSNCWCGDKADTIVGGIVGFCFYHYNRCNVEKCEFGISKTTKTRGVVATANHLTMDGRRVCHHHARSQKGVLSDTALAQKGVIIQAVAAGGPSVGGL